MLSDLDGGWWSAKVSPMLTKTMSQANPPPSQPKKVLGSASRSLAALISLARRRCFYKGHQLVPVSAESDDADADAIIVKKKAGAGAAEEITLTGEFRCG